VVVPSGPDPEPCNQDLRGAPQTTAAGAAYTQSYPQGGQRSTLDATRIAADGSAAKEDFAAPESPPVDCFYVYPTVDLLPNPLLQVGSLAPAPQDTEMAVTLAQAARFSGLAGCSCPSTGRTRWPVSPWES
jgi:hypothetical protein